MGELKDPLSVKYFSGLITGFPEMINEVRAVLIHMFGDIDLESGPFDWNFTNYYKYQMGGNLKRYFFSFERLATPDFLVQMKLSTNKIEAEFAGRVDGIERPINLDPGYVSYSSMILASTKPYAHRIYLSNGIYAQVDYLFKSKGDVTFTPWVYPDYKTIEYINFFQSVRMLLLSEMRIMNNDK